MGLRSTRLKEDRVQGRLDSCPKVGRATTSSCLAGGRGVGVGTGPSALNSPVKVIWSSVLMPSCWGVLRNLRPASKAITCPGRKVPRCSQLGTGTGGREGVGVEVGSSTLGSVPEWTSSMSKLGGTRVGVGARPGTAAGLGVGVGGGAWLKTSRNASPAGTPFTRTSVTSSLRSKATSPPFSTQKGREPGDFISPKALMSARPKSSCVRGTSSGSTDCQRSMVSATVSTVPTMTEPPTPRCISKA